MTRVRTCSNPAPNHGGANCTGEHLQSKHCTLEPCPIHGGWSDWNAWGSCARTCGIGMAHRDRTCTNPKPQRFGDHCFGDANEHRICMDTTCKDGTWSAWDDWASCTVTCGIGVIHRHRTCGNSTLAHQGYECVGSDIESKVCNAFQCAEPRTCYDIMRYGIGNSSGVYSVYSPISDRRIEVFCDLETEGGGWTNRFNGSVNFYRPFADYEAGFGTIHGEFWLGLKLLNELTTGVEIKEIRVDIEAANGRRAYDVYRPFSVAAGPDYTVHLSNRVRSHG
ncbi:HMCN1-like protein, partial [Mya arenaria]